MSTSYPEFLERLRCVKRFCTYQDIADSLGVNQYYLWKILNEENYIPPVSVRRKLGIVMDDRPPRIAIRKDDPESAARSLLANIETGTLRRVIMIVKERIEG